MYIDGRVRAARRSKAHTKQSKNRALFSLDDLYVCVVAGRPTDRLRTRRRSPLRGLLAETVAAASQREGVGVQVREIGERRFGHERPDTSKVSSVARRG
ncbi:hypothetical protein Q1695_000350 [Nippostrongylus brasiliensis]|nr:hypothetical protein Q1695_000350 [Nippostrongylus brasiliensis]